MKRLAPSPRFIADKRNLDTDTLRALLVGRMHVIRRFSLDVLKPVTRSARSGGRWTVARRRGALPDQLQDWCQQAEATDIHALERFSQQLRGLALADAATTR